MRFDLITLNLVLAIAETQSITRGAEPGIRISLDDLTSAKVRAALASGRAVVAHRFARIFTVQPLVPDEDCARQPSLLAVRIQEVLPTVVQRFVEALCGAARPQAAAVSAITAPVARQSDSRKR